MSPQEVAAEGLSGTFALYNETLDLYNHVHNKQKLIALHRAETITPLPQAATALWAVGLSSAGSEVV